MAKPYYILTGIVDTGTRDLLFGAYDREDCVSEREMYTDRYDYLDPADPEHATLLYSAMRVHRLPDDRQITIDAFMREVNK